MGDSFNSLCNYCIPGTKEDCMCVSSIFTLRMRRGRPTESIYFISPVLLHSDLPESD